LGIALPGRASQRVVDPEQNLGHISGIIHPSFLFAGIFLTPFAAAWILLSAALSPAFFPSFSSAFFYRLVLHHPRLVFFIRKRAGRKNASLKMEATKDNHSRQQNYHGCSSR